MEKDLKDRLAVLKLKNLGKKYLKVYLKELNALVNINVLQENLIPLEKSPKAENISENKKKVRWKFDEKAKLEGLVNKLVKLRDDDLLLITEYSKFCGALKLSSLKSFNIQFDFNAEHAGIIVLRLCDNSNKLLLDYYQDEGENILEIEVSGKDWPNAL